jgi:transposase
MQEQQIISKYYCGVDVHPRTSFFCVMDALGNIELRKNIKNNFDVFKDYLNPYLPDIAVGCESTYCYYWLADGCHEADIPFYLGHALYMKAISGHKKKNDKLDSKTIANLMRTNYFPLAYPYPREMRATRDLLRRRHRLVRIRAEAYSHIQMVFQQYAIDGVTSAMVKNKKTRRQLIEKFQEYDLRNQIASDLDVIDAFDPLIEKLEKDILSSAKDHNHKHLALLMTIPGVGYIIALDILYETHDITRFPKVQHYSSYSRVVKCDRSSSGKSVDKKNQKIGNPYLKWAFSQIIMSARLSSEPIAKYYQRLESKHGMARARAMIAHKFAVAVYFMLKNEQAFDEKRFVGFNKY